MAALIDPADLSTYLGYEVDSDRATLAAELASGLIRAWCRWEISSETVTFICDGPGSKLLSLPTLALNAVAEVRVDSVALDVSDYQWSARGQLIRNDCCWPSTMRSIAVDATHGYDVIPDAVKAVALALGSRATANPEQYNSVATGTAIRSWQPAAASDVAASSFTGVELSILGPWRLPATP